MLQFNCPFQTLIDCFRTQHPRKPAIAKFENPEMGMIPEGAKGVTFFPEDSSRPPLVLVRSDLPVRGALDILAHELAHVACGTSAEHGPLWEAAYDALFREYGQRIAEQNWRLQCQMDPEYVAGDTVMFKGDPNRKGYQVLWAAKTPNHWHLKGFEGPVLDQLIERCGNSASFST